MNGKWAFVSYLIVVASTLSLLIPAILTPCAFSPYCYSNSPLSSGIMLIILPVAGMILGPYLGVASLIARERSVWAETSRLINAHISLPIAGGLVIFLESLSAFNFINYLLPVYVAFVVLVTLLKFAASKTSKSVTAPPALVLTAPSTVTP
jgi:hypothetical protein